MMLNLDVLCHSHDELKKNIFAHFERVTISFLDHIRIQSVDGKPKSPGQPVGAGGCESHPLPLVGE